MNDENKKGKSVLKRVTIILSSLAILLFIVLLLLQDRFDMTGGRSRLRIEKLRDIAELATVEYRIRKIVKFREDSILGSRRLLIEVPATLKAGIDLNRIFQKDIVTSGKSITVYLPEPELIDLIIDTENTREIVNETGLLRSDFSPEERNEFLKKGEAKIRQYIAEGKIDILDSAAQNTRILLRSWLSRAGYEDINIIFKKERSVEFKPSEN